MKINIVKYIPELIYRHDCVIIPGFGGFIGNYSPSRINPVYHTFYPPYKSLLFNIHLKQNDGLLASCISQAEQIPYEHAMEEIRRMLFDWHRALENGQELIIEKVGKIVKESDGILQFEQDLSVNYLPDAFGLTTLVSPAIRRPGMQDRLGKKLDRYVYASPGKSRKLTRTLRWAAILAFPLGLAIYFSITNMDQIRSFNQNYTGFLFSGSNTTPDKKVASHWIVLPAEKKIIPAPKTVTVKQESVQEKQNVKPEVTENTKPAVKNPFAIIVGAFRFRNNADNLVSKLKQEGYDAGIFDTTTTGLFRVCLGSFANRDEALAQLAVVRANNYSSAWLLAK
jgi:hypothetical protein